MPARYLATVRWSHVDFMTNYFALTMAPSRMAPSRMIIRWFLMSLLCTPACFAAAEQRFDYDADLKALGVSADEVAKMDALLQSLLTIRN